MIYTHNTEDGGFGFGFLENKEDVKKLYEALREMLGIDDDDVNDEVNNDEVDVNDEVNDYDPTELECDNQITVGYDDDGTVGYVTFTPPPTSHSLACALLGAAAAEWPIRTDADKRLVRALRELSAIRDDIDADEYDVEDGE